MSKFTEAQQIHLRHLREMVLAYDVQIRRLVGLYAAENGVDLSKNNVTFNLDDMTYAVEEIKEKKSKDK